MSEAAGRVKSLDLLGTPNPIFTLLFRDFAATLDFSRVEGRSPRVSSAEPIL